MKMLLFKNMSQREVLNVAKAIGVEAYPYSLGLTDKSLRRITEEEMDEFSCVLVKDLGEHRGINEYEYEYQMYSYINLNANTIRINKELIEAVENNPTLFPSISIISIPETPFRILKNNLGAEFIEEFGEEKWIRLEGDKLVPLRV